MIDVMIITYNEAINLPHCLSALQGWTNKIFVVDSGSTDGTQDIARSYGAEVIHHDWPGYAKQKNWGLANLPLTSPWTFIIDADEVITNRLRTQITQITSKPVDSVVENGFFINRLTYFLNKPIHHCGYFPSWNLRLFKRGLGVYEDREVHEHIIIDNPLGYISEPMLHNDRRGLEHFIAKHNRYSTLEARSIYRDIVTHSDISLTPNISAQTRRNRWMKRHLIPHIPGTPLWRFFYMYVLRMGILDGRAGYEFCKFISMYDYMVSVKLKALKRGVASPSAQVATHSSLALPEGSPPRTGPLQAPQPLPQIKQTPSPESVSVDSDPSRPMPRDSRADAMVHLTQPDRPPVGQWPSRGSVPVSVLIPVKNEERNIVECLRHVMWASEIVVVDSHSTDLTVPLAQSMGADVYCFTYSSNGWPKKKNWALDTVRWKNEWVLILDADEIMMPKLAEEIRRVVVNQPSENRRKDGCGDGYWLNRRFMFMGTWIKGCGYYPSYNIRLFRHRVGRYERIGALGDTSSGDNEVHEHIVLTTGQAGYLEGDFLHYAYPNLATWIDKHNRYSNWEAYVMGEDRLGSVQASILGGPIERRRWIKKVVRHLPFRPTLRFLYSYILKRGFLDGYSGYVMSRLMGWYEFISIAKYHEMKKFDSRTPNLPSTQMSVTTSVKPDAGK